MYGLEASLDAMPWGKTKMALGQGAYRGYERNNILVNKRCFLTCCLYNVVKNGIDCSNARVFRKLLWYVKKSVVRPSDPSPSSFLSSRAKKPSKKTGSNLASININRRKPAANGRTHYHEFVSPTTTWAHVLGLDSVKESGSTVQYVWLKRSYIVQHSIGPPGIGRSSLQNSQSLQKSIDCDDGAAARLAWTWRTADW
jgi:hypothetical protein